MGSFGSHFIRFSACRRAAFTAWQEQSFSLSVQVSENDGLEVLKRTQMTQWCERSIRSIKIFQHKLVYTSVFERVPMDVIFPKTHEFEVSICTRILCNRASIGWFSASESSVLRWSGNGLLESGKQLQQQQHNNNTRKSLKVCMREGLEEERERESVANQHIWRKVGRKLLVISPQHITQHHIQMPQPWAEQRERNNSKSKFTQFTVDSIRIRIHPAINIAWVSRVMTSRLEIIVVVLLIETKVLIRWRPEISSIHHAPFWQIYSSLLAWWASQKFSPIFMAELIEKFCRRHHHHRRRARDIITISIHSIRQRVN